MSKTSTFYETIHRLHLRYRAGSAYGEVSYRALAALLPETNNDLAEYSPYSSIVFQDFLRVMLQRQKEADSAGRGSGVWRQVYEAPSEGTAAVRQLKTFVERFPD